MTFFEFSRGVELLCPNITAPDLYLQHCCIESFYNRLDELTAVPIAAMLGMDGQGDDDTFATHLDTDDVSDYALLFQYKERGPQIFSEYEIRIWMREGALLDIQHPGQVVRRAIPNHPVYTCSLDKNPPPAINLKISHQHKRPK